MSNYKSFFLKSMGMREDQLPGGKGDNTPPQDVDPQQLEMGIKVEMEHTKDREIAREIAMDHLTEDPQYYSHLKNAGMADELPKGLETQIPQISKLLNPTKIMQQPVIGVAVRGTASGGLPGGGIVNDPEKARFGGFEPIKNLKPNSQGTIEDTPVSKKIQEPGGHYTPDNAEITSGKAPNTSVNGSEKIHPMQIQQLGNKPIEDDGTTHDGHQDIEEEPKSSQKTMWGIPLDGKDSEAGEAEEFEEPSGEEPSGEEPEAEEEFGGKETPTPEDDNDEDDEEKVEIDIDENKNWIQKAIKHPGALKAKDLTPDSPLTNSDLDDLESHGDSTTKHQVNLARTLKSFNEMKSRFQKLANIKENQCECDEIEDTIDETQVLSEKREKREKLRNMVSMLKAQGKTPKMLEYAERYLAEFDDPNDAAWQRAKNIKTNNLDELIKSMVEVRDEDDNPNKVADAIVKKAQELGISGVEKKYDYILTKVTQNWD